MMLETELWSNKMPNSSDLGPREIVHTIIFSISGLLHKETQHERDTSFSA